MHLQSVLGRLGSSLTPIQFADVAHALNRGPDAFRRAVYRPHGFLSIWTDETVALSSRLEGIRTGSVDWTKVAPVHSMGFRAARQDILWYGAQPNGHPPDSGYTCGRHAPVADGRMRSCRRSGAAAECPDNL